MLPVVPSLRPNVAGPDLAWRDARTGEVAFSFVRRGVVRDSPSRMEGFRLRDLRPPAFGLRFDEGVALPVPRDLHLGEKAFLAVAPKEQVRPGRVFRQAAHDGVGDYHGLPRLALRSLFPYLFMDLLLAW